MEALIVLDNRVRLRERGVPGAALKDVRSRFEHKNAQRALKKRLGVPHWDEPHVIETWLGEVDRAGEGWLSLPRGGLGRVREVLADHGIPWRVDDRRVQGADAPPVPRSRVKLWPHQDEIVEACLAKEQCLVRSGTGSGKTTALIALAGRLGRPVLVVVHSRALMDQWLERLVRETGLRPREIGVIQGKRFRLAPVTVALQASLATRARGADWLDYFGAVFADEVHLFAARTFFASIDPFRARYRIGATADERRKDRKEFLVHDLFGDVAADISHEELVEGNHVLDVEVRVVPTSFQAEWYGVPDDDSGGDKKLDFIRLVKEMAACPDRNRLAVELARDEAAAGHQALVMAHEREHCMRLGAQLVAGGTPAGYLIGGADYAGEFRSTRERLVAGELRCAVGTYKAIGTGIDLPLAAAAVAVTPIASNPQFFNQVRGRVCRTAEGKEGARLYVLWDRFVYPRHLQNIARWNPNTIVWMSDGEDGGEWLPVRQFLREMRRSA